MKTVCHEIPKEDYIALQLKMAGDVIENLIDLDPDLEGLISPDTLLDALGCTGLSLHIGDESSLAWIQNLSSSVE